MWDRTKRLINSYLDNLIERADSPDSGARSITRSEIARLSEIEVQARASAKMLEKELAEIELKLLGASERARLALDSTASTSEVQTLSAHRDMLKSQIAEANASAEKAKSLREQRRIEGEDLATQSQLSSIRETVSSVHSGFDVNDPAAVIDEMKSRIGRSAPSENDLRLQEADRVIDAERKQSKIDELLASYKQSILEPDAPVIRQDTSRPAANPPSNQPANRSSDQLEPGEKEPAEEKTLGRADPTVRPID